MRTLHAPASFLNPTPAARQLPDDNAPSLIPTDRAYESLAIAMEAEDDARALAYWAEFEQGMQDHEDDLACQRSDDAHARSVAPAIATVKAAVGTAEVEITRHLRMTTTGNRVEWFVKIDGASIVHAGLGETVDGAVAHALESLDLTYLAEAFGGIRVAGVAFIGGFPNRSKDEARQLARRIVLDPTYLDAALAVQLDGVTDLRPRPAPAIVAA